MNFELREVRSETEMEAAKSIRLRVFVEEQKVPPEIEMDEFDAKAIHVICLIQGKVAGTGRLVKMPDGIKLGRVAVLPEFRGRDLGKAIVHWLLDKASFLQAKSVYANVQISAKGFYEKLGFTPEGSIFIEAGIQHVKMLRTFQ